MSCILTPPLPLLVVLFSLSFFSLICCRLYKTRTLAVKKATFGWEKWEDEGSALRKRRTSAEILCLLLLSLVQQSLFAFFATERERDRRKEREREREWDGFGMWERNGMKGTSLYVLLDKNSFFSTTSQRILSHAKRRQVHPSFNCLTTTIHIHTHKNSRNLCE